MHSFGHAAYFGLGAYGAALLLQGARPADGSCARCSRRCSPRSARSSSAGSACASRASISRCSRSPSRRSSGRSSSSGTTLTGGSNGLVGIWPSPWLAPKPAYYLLALAFTVLGCGVLVRMLHRAASAYALRAEPRFAAARGRDRHSTCRACSGSRSSSPARSRALAGSLFAFAKGTISPETLGVGQSVDGLVMVLLGGVQAVSGPWVGAARCSCGCRTRWRGRRTTGGRCSGCVMLALVLVFPLGIAGGLKRLVHSRCRWL